MNEKYLGQRYEIKSVPPAFADAVQSFVDTLDSDEKDDECQEGVSLKDLPGNLYANTINGLEFAARSFLVSRFILMTRKEGRDNITIQKIWDLSTERYHTSALLRRQKNNDADLLDDPNQK